MDHVIPRYSNTYPIYQRRVLAIDSAQWLRRAAYEHVILLRNEGTVFSPDVEQKELARSIELHQSAYAKSNYFSVFTASVHAMCYCCRHTTTQSRLACVEQIVAVSMVVCLVDDHSSDLYNLNTIIAVVSIMYC